MKISEVLISVLFLLTETTFFVERVNAGDPTDAPNGNSSDNNNNNSVKQIERFERIIKSPRDSSSYRYLKLTNDLSVLLISDPDTDKAAACMTVATGFMHDHEELPGLAHFLEHMLFLGSEKYPEDNYFTKFVSEHAGKDNGSTCEDIQNYFWNIAYEYLEEALDIFAQFFLKPLLDSAHADREAKVVDSEFSMNRTKDLWRISQLQCALSKPGHPHGHCGIGNLKSLTTAPQEKGINVREKLLEFYSNRYSSNLMYLAVLGKESLDELEKLVVPRFEIIKNKKLPRSVYTEHPWGPEQVKRRVHYSTMADIRQLTLRFPMSTATQHYKTAPLRYIRTLIGHEGPGSIWAELKRRNWCGSLVVGTDSIPGFSFFYINIKLTKEAMDHIDDIVKLVFQYIYLLKKEEPKKWIFDEIKKINETAFENANKPLPLSRVRNASLSMMDYPIEDLLSHGALLDEWNPGLIQYFLDYLTPNNMTILIGGKSFKEVEGRTQTEPWYGTKYNVEVISDDFIDKTWKITELYEKLHLPFENKFITENFRVHPIGTNESKNPRVIHESSISKFWFKQDEEFKFPRMNIRFDIYSPLTCLNAENIGLIRIFVSLFVEKYVAYGYAAVIAGLSWKVTTIRCGIEVNLFGYDEKLPLLLENLVSEMIQFQPDPKKFEIKKETRFRRLKNFATSQPYAHSKFHLSHLLSYAVYAQDEFLAAVKSLQIQNMYKLVKRLFSRVFIQGLIYGNCDERLGVHVVSIIENAFKSASVLLPQEVAFARSLEMEDGSTFNYTTTHKHSSSSSYYGYFQVAADYCLRNVVLTTLFAHFVSEKCFQVLRTEEQLGYVVWCGVQKKKGVVSFGVMVQSERHPAYLDSRVEMFLRTLRKSLQNLAVEEVEKYKTSLINTYMEKIVGQGQKASYYWGEIRNRRYLFDKKKVMSELVKSLRKEDLLDFFHKYICESSSKRRKVTIYVISEVTNPVVPEDVLGGTKVDDVVAFKNGSGWFPLPAGPVQVTSAECEHHKSDSDVFESH